MASQRLVLVGGGHAHVEVLRRWALKPMPAAELVVVSADLDPPYSGMIPAVIAGHVAPEVAAVDLRALAWQAKARLLHDVVTRVDPVTRRVFRPRGEAVSYDVLSLNLGSTPAIAGIPGAAEFALPVKPIPRFLAGVQRWEAILAEREQTDLRIPSHPPGAPFAVVVVGAGAAGCEVLLALKYRWRNRPHVTWTLVSGDPEPLATFPPRMRRGFRRAFFDQGVHFIGGERVTGVEAGALTLSSGLRLPHEALILATGAAAPGWLQNTGLELDPGGFIAVDVFLRSRSHPEVFGAGDCVTQVDDPRPKAGVFAVRQGPPLFANLVHALRREPLVAFHPQREFLAILTTGRRHAIATRGPFTISGEWVWRWKQRIDQRWLARYHVPRAGSVPKSETRPGDSGLKR